MRRVLLTMLGVLLVSSSVWAYRSKRPPAFTDLQDPNQLTELNNTLADFWNIGNGRYTLENLTTDPQDTRKGQKGDLVYSTFGGNEHLCVNTSFPAGFEWTCVNVGTLSDCPGGADTQVQFNDNGDCGGDVSFIYDKNLNHAALGTSSTAVVSGIAVIDESTFVSGYYDGIALGSTQILNVRDTFDTDSSDTDFYSAVSGHLQLNHSTSPDAGWATGVYGSILSNTSSADANNDHFSGVLGSARYTGTNASSNGQIIGVRGLAESDGIGDTQVVAGVKGECTIGPNHDTPADNHLCIGIYAAGPSETGASSTGTTDVTYGALVENFGSFGIDANYGLEVDIAAPSAGSSTEGINFYSLPTWRISEGTTLANQRFNYFSAPSISGVSGGGTETATNASTVYIAGAPTQSGGANPVISNATAFLSDAQTWTLTSAQTRAQHFHNQFLAPTLNGVAGGAAETVTDAATVYIDAAPSGSNITLTTSSDLMFGNTSTSRASIKVQNQTAANTAGRGLELSSGAGNGTGAGGLVYIFSEVGGATGNGGAVTIEAAQSGSTSGTGGAVNLTAGNSRGNGTIGGQVLILAGNGVSGNSDGGYVTFQPGSASGTGLPGIVQVSGVSETIPDATGTWHLLDIDPATWTVASGGTVTNLFFANFETESINGVAGGGTETLTNGANVYIEGAPSGSNITFTNGPYALWVDAGRTRFDGFVDMFASATVTGILTVDGSTITNDISTGFGAVELAAGVWTPTTNDIANLDASSASEGQYIRVGSSVSFSVQLTVNPTLTATSTQTELDLPVASNFGATSDAAGSCSAPGIVSMSAAVTADAASNELEIRFIASDVTSQELDCTGVYQVI